MNTQRFWSTIACGVTLAVAISVFGKAPEQSTGKAQPDNPITVLDKRGTDDVPIAVKIVVAPDAATKAAEEKKERDEKTANDSQLVKWTYWLFVATVVLAVVAAVQVGFFRWQLVLMRDGLKDAALAATAAKESTDIARAALTASQRPKLHVRNVSVQDLVFVEPGPIAGQFTIVNIGGTIAEITSSHHHVFWTRKELRMPPPYDLESPTNLVLGFLQPGVPLRVVFAANRAKEIEKQPNWELYVMGWIAYSDALNVGRRCAFCFKYNPESHRFRAVADDDYHHED